MIILIQTKSLAGDASYYTVGRVAEVAGTFDFGTIEPGSNWAMVEAPRPDVLNIDGSGNNTQLTIFIPSPAAHVHASSVASEAVVDSYQLLVARGVGAEDPGRDPAAWTLLQTIPTESDGSSVIVAADCRGPEPYLLLALRPVFDGGQFAGDYVGPLTRIACKRGRRSELIPRFALERP